MGYSLTQLPLAAWPARIEPDAGSLSVLIGKPIDVARFAGRFGSAELVEETGEFVVRNANGEWMQGRKA